jgi:hypothetical protein
MRRGFIFTLLTFILFSILLSVALDVRQREIAGAQTAQRMLVAEKIITTFDDVSEGVTGVVQLYVAQNSNNLTIGDSLPANATIQNNLGAYDKFIKQYYNAQDLEVKFLNPDGTEMNLSQIDPESMITILPWGLKYAYPDYGKNELRISYDKTNYTAVQQISITLNVLNAWFNKTYSSTDCKKDWAPLKTDCGGDPCLNFNLTIIDMNGTVYNAPCTTFNLKFDSNLRVDFANATNTNIWVNVLVGSLPDALTIQMHNVYLNTTTVLAFNTTSYSANLLSKLMVRDKNYNVSRTEYLS